MAEVHPQDIETAKDLVQLLGGFDWYSEEFPHSEYNTSIRGEPVKFRLLKDKTQAFYLVEVILPPGLAVTEETTSVLLAYPTHQPKEED